MSDSENIDNSCMDKALDFIRKNADRANPSTLMDSEIPGFSQSVSTLIGNLATEEYNDCIQQQIHPRKPSSPSR